MSLIQISVENYRGIGPKQILEFARPNAKTAGSGLTVLVGPNNSGKSTVLRAINAIYSSDKDFLAETEDRRGETFPNVEATFEVGGQQKRIGTSTVDKSAYLQKTGDVADAANRCLYIPARRPWSDRFTRNVGYARDTYEIEADRNRKANEFYVDQQFGNMLYTVERDKGTKQHFLEVLQYIEPTITDFWVDRAHGQDFLAFKSASGFSHRAGIVGEGILNIFRLCHALIYLNERETLLVDEPELSLHPQSQRRLYHLLASRAGDRQVIASTHSVHFVDWGHIRSDTKSRSKNLLSRMNQM